MISIISGKIIEKNENSLVVMTSGGVGYEISTQVGKYSPMCEQYGVRTLRRTSWQVGDEVSLYTYLKVSDTNMELYGFENKEEREFFSLLLSVSGVGPKSAMNILSLGPVEEIKSAIVREDVEFLTAVQGMGKRTAERMVVELKNKIQDTNNNIQTKTGKILSEVIDGLVGMGYSREEAKTAVRELEVGEKNTEELLKEALGGLSKK